jgi:hypothetical protein
MSKLHSACITGWQITQGNVAGLIAAGRARWKIENQNNYVLKNLGYHLEHNFGHGKKHLASLLMKGLEIGPYAVKKKLNLTHGRSTRPTGVGAAHVPIPKLGSLFPRPRPFRPEPCTGQTALLTIPFSKMNCWLIF